MYNLKQFSEFKIEGIFENIIGFVLKNCTVRSFKFIIKGGYDFKIILATQYQFFHGFFAASTPEKTADFIYLSKLT
jgi:hypothetical protein